MAAVKPRYVKREILFTTEEAKTLEREADELGLSLSVHVRRLIAEQKKGPANIKYRRFRDGREISRGSAESLDKLFKFITVSDERRRDANNNLSFFMVTVDGELSHIVWLFRHNEMTSMEMAARFITDCNRFATGAFKGECVIDMSRTYNDNGYGLYVAEAKGFKHRVVKS